MALTLHICPGDNGAVVWASGDVDTNAAETFQDMMQSVMRRHSPSLLLDLSGVSFMDCAGLRALLAARRQAEMRGGFLRLIAASAAVRRITELTGADEALAAERSVTARSVQFLRRTGRCDGRQEYLRLPDPGKRGIG